MDQNNVIRNGWTSIILSDDKQFYLDGPDGYQCYWHNLRLERESFCNRNHGAGTVMILAGISHDELTDLAFYMESKNQKIIKKSWKIISCLLLRGYMVLIIPWISRRLMNRTVYFSISGIFQQDNAPIHNSKLKRTFLYFSISGIFHQDNAPIHNSELTRTYFQET